MIALCVCNRGNDHHGSSRLRFGDEDTKTIGKQISFQFLIYVLNKTNEFIFQNAVSSHPGLAATPAHSLRLPFTRQPHRHHRRYN